MDYRSEFLRIVNSAVDQQSHDDGKNHAGEEIVVLIPAPADIVIDCKDTSEINLDNIEISATDGKVFDHQSGELVFDAGEMGQVLYKVTGTVR